MTRVFRVEDAEGRGPYNPGAGRSGLAFQLADIPGGRAPGPTFRFGEHDRFAFQSRADYGRWFSPAQRRFLTKHGFKLRQYEVPTAHVHRDAAQVAYDPRFAREAGSGHWVTIDGHPVFIKE